MMKTRIAMMNMDRAVQDQAICKMIIEIYIFSM